MTYAELRALMDANEYEHAKGALARIRYATLEARVSRAEATAKEERRLRYQYTLDENDELTRLRAENAQLRADNEALRRAALSAAPVERRPEPAALARPASVVRHRPASKPLLDPAALAIMKRDPPDPAGFDRTIGDEEA